ncbi:MAG: M48 family metalloprotease [Saprospiraceae bacterium]|nr:M48 family metalloprotease [Saprospiraceae bacterium]
MHLLFDHLLPVSDAFIRPFCWTLLHSLWQGVLLALLAGLVLQSTQKTSSALRYQLLALLFALFFATVAATFIWQWQQTAETGAALAVPAETAASTGERADITLATSFWTSGYQSYLDAGIAFFNRHAAVLTLLWALVFLLKCLNMILDLYRIRQLRTRGAIAPPAGWQNRVQVLAAQLGIRQRVTLLESARVQVPSAIGILKPVILVPLGLLAQLPAEQVEGILLHELAHIRRRDFLVNLLQHVAETIFFFNPAVLWVSALLREEREHCCDELAVATLRHKAGYLNALLYFEKFKPAPYALAFPGAGKGHLLNRVKRIIGQGNTKSLSNMEKVTLVSCLILAGCLALLPLSDAQAQGKTKPQISSINVIGKGTAADPEQMTITETGGKTYKLTRINQKIRDLYVNGQQVPEGQIADYADLIRSVDDQLRQDREQAERDAAQAKLDAEQAQRDAEQAERDAALAKLDAEQAERDAEQAERDAEQAKRDAVQAKLDSEQAERDRYQGSLDAEQAKRDAAQADKDRQQAKRDAEQAKRDAEQAKRDVAQAKLDAEQAKRDAEQAKRDAEQAKLDAEQAKKDQEMVENLIQELIREQLVPDKKSLSSFHLSASEFVVNGKSVPAETHQKFKAKYLKNSDYSIYYGYKNRNGVGIFYNDNRN